MINNNRQQNGRRRGRGGQRQGGGGNQGNGSRIDNRARGNAVQLLEKYKNLAADAQRQGDRVNTEYYLQFADHYFRVVSEQRGRFEEQDRQRRDAQNGFDDGFDGDEFDGDDNEVRETRTEQPREQRRFDGERPERGGERAERGNDRGERGGDRDGPRRERAPRDANRYEGRDDRPQRESRAPRAELAPAEGVPALEGDPIESGEQQAAPRPRRGRPRREDAPPVVTANDGFDPDRLPPSFAPPANDGGAVEAAEGEEAPRPRRRRLRATDATQAS